MSIALTNGIGDFYFQVGARPVVCCFTRLPAARPTASLGETQIGYWISRTSLSAPTYLPTYYLACPHRGPGGYLSAPPAQPSEET